MVMNFHLIICDWAFSHTLLDGEVLQSALGLSNFLILSVLGEEFSTLLQVDICEDCLSQKLTGSGQFLQSAEGKKLLSHPWLDCHGIWKTHPHPSLR